MTHPYRDAGPEVATSKTGAPKTAMAGTAGCFEDTTLTLVAHQEIFLISRFRISPPVAGVVAELHFGGRR